MKILNLFLYLFILSFSYNIWANEDQPQVREIISQLISRVQSEAQGKTNPFLMSRIDANEIGRVHKRLRQAFPSYQNVQKAYQKNFEHGMEINEFISLLNETINDLNNVLSSRNPKTDEIFAGLEALRLLSKLESRSNWETSEGLKEEKDKKEDKEKEDKEEKKTKKPEEEDHSDPWDTDPDKYKPKNKDINSGENQSPKKPKIMQMTTTKVEKKLFKRSYLDVITATHLAENVNIRPKRTISPERQVDLKNYNEFSYVVSYGRNSILFFTQYGFEPVVGNYGDYSVEEIKPGTFEVRALSNKVPGNFKIAIINEKNDYKFESAENLDQYKAPTGIPQNQWPDEIQELIKELRSKGYRDLKVAEILANWYSKDAGYYYYAEGDEKSGEELAELKRLEEKYKKTMAEPVAMTKARILQCDGSAWAGASLLRDFFQIPARVVLGRTSAGITKFENRRVRAINANDPKHAWVEVWDGSLWHPFDFTPTRNPPKSEATNSELQPEREEEQNEQNEKDSKPSQEKESKGDSEKKEKVEEKDGKEKEADKEDKDSGKEKEGQKKQAKEDNSSKKVPGKLSKNDEKFELSKSLGTSSNSFTDEILKVIEQYFIEDLINLSNRKTVVSEALSALDSLKKAFLASEISASQNKMVSLLGSIRGSIDEEIKVHAAKIQSLVIDGQVNQAHKELQQLTKVIEEVAKRRSLKVEENDFLNKIEKLKSAFRSINHEKASELKAVNDFIDNLPGNISKSVLEDRYGENALKPGSPGQIQIAKDLMDGKLSSLLRTSLLSKYLDFVLNSQNEPAFDEFLTYYKDPEPKRNNSDLVLATSPLEFPRMILQPEPGKHIFDNLFRNKQFMLGTRETVLLEDPESTIERKFTVVLYDVSGSMGGDRSELQDSIISAIVDRSLSEVNASGEPIHEVVLVPFASEVQEGREIFTQEDAKSLIIQKESFITRAGGGTDIQKALIKFYEVVIAAWESKDDLSKKFQRANLVLLTDGGSNVNIDRVEEVRSRLPKNLKIRMNLVNIEDKNEQLIELASKTNKENQKSMWNHINGEDMRKILSQSNRATLDDKAFFTTKKSYEIPTSIQIAAKEFREAATTFRETVNVPAILKIKSNLNARSQDLEKLKTQSVIGEAMVMISQIIKTSPPMELRRQILQRFLQRYKDYIGRPYSDLAYTERDGIRALIEWSGI